MKPEVLIYGLVVCLAGLFNVNNVHIVTALAGLWIIIMAIFD